MHFYSIQIRSSFLIQVSCMVYTIKTLEFKKLEWRFGCKTCIVYTGFNAVCLVEVQQTRISQSWTPPEIKLTTARRTNYTTDVIRDRPFNLQGRGRGYVFFRFAQKFFFGQHESQNIYFFPQFNIRLYDKNSESDYFFFPPPKSEYFFQQHWESEYFFLEKKPYTYGRGDRRTDHL